MTSKIFDDVSADEFNQVMYDLFKELGKHK